MIKIITISQPKRYKSMGKKLVWLQEKGIKGVIVIDEDIKTIDLKKLISKCKLIKEKQSEKYNNKEVYVTKLIKV